MAASTASIVFVWLYLGTFNLASKLPATLYPTNAKADSSDPVLFSYPAEVQTFSMRSKSMLVWNAITQIEYVYVVFVDAIALEAIGA
jgi:SP family sugar:H+ symporter-like MFS transporter